MDESTIPEKIKPAYSSELAKKRLLSIYDLNLEYLNGKLVYKLHCVSSRRSISSRRAPARLVLETFGAKVGWNGDSRLVLVSTDHNLPVSSPEELMRHAFQAQLNWEIIYGSKGETAVAFFLTEQCESVLNL